MTTDYNPDDLEKMPVVAALIHQIASARVVKAFVVYSFAIAAILLMVTGREVPDLLHSVVLIFVGVIFEAATTQGRNGKT